MSIFPPWGGSKAVSYTHLRAHETEADLVCRLLLEKKSQNPKPGSAQVAWLGFGLIWEEILTEWLENGPNELIFYPFGTEMWSRVRFWGSGRSKMASFGGFANISKIAQNFA